MNSMAKENHINLLRTLPARANKSFASEFNDESETPHVLRWPFISLQHSAILTH